MRNEQDGKFVNLPHKLWRKESFGARLIDMHKRSILKYIGNYVKSDNYVKSKISENIKSDIK